MTLSVGGGGRCDSNHMSLIVYSMCVRGRITCVVKVKLLPCLKATAT